MGASNEINSSCFKTFPSGKIMSVESSLQQTLTNFKELVSEFEELHLENNKYRNMYLSQKEKCESQTCESCEELKKHILREKDILESVVLALNKLSETRDFNILDKIFNLINKDTSPTSPNIYDCKVNKELISPKKELSIDNVSHEESLSEIDGTPGRKSPIIQSKKLKSNSSYSLSLKEKKKCPESWPTPEKKSIKLSFPTPTHNKTGRLKQARLNLVKMKTTSVVDLTCSPETTRSYSELNMQCNIKKEMFENDDTILPSPTSGPIVQLPPMYKSISKESPSKFKKPLINARCKLEIDRSDQNIENIPFVEETIMKDAEDSINLLKQFPNRFKSPLKKDRFDDETHCADESISLLQHVKKIEEKDKTSSPKKLPLVENLNLINTEKLPEFQSSMSILQQDIVQAEVKNEVHKRLKNNIEPVYKEPVLRRKAEKRAIPGWSCDECKNFYDELYKDDMDMLAKKMDECSKHRGKNNPIRPKTPEGFWNPRWDVPDDTEEFNLRNNAI